MPELVDRADLAEHAAAMGVSQERGQPPREHPEARDEYLDAVAYYGQQRAGLGAEG